MSNVAVTGGLCIVAVTGLSVGAAVLVDRYLPADKRRGNNEVAGVLFSIIGVVYAILLTFVTIAVWEASAQADESSRTEARAVVEIDRYATALGEPRGAPLHDLVKRYVNVVVDDEWPRMAAGRPVAGEGADLVDQMWKAVDTVVPSGDAELGRQAEARADLRALGQARDNRLAGGDAGLPGVIWYALIVSALLAVVNAMMFGVDGRSSYVGMVGILAAVSTLLLFAVYQLEYPYQRGERVTVDTFVSVTAALST